MNKDFPDDPPHCAACLHFYAVDCVGKFCGHPKARRFDAVDGRVVELATEARKGGKACGPDGKLFMDRPPPSMFAEWLYQHGVLLFFVAAMLLAIAMSMKDSQWLDLWTAAAS